jgi:metal-responsive CopG/Arc/MetJ family transcriptional regulator
MGAAIEAAVLKKFEDLIARRGYTNRPKAFRGMIREALIEKTA